MYGLAVNLIVSVSGHPWIINEIFETRFKKFDCKTFRISWEIYKKLKIVEFFNMGLFIFEIEILIFCKNRFLANAKSEDFHFENKKSHVEKIHNFQLFLDFSTDLECLLVKFFKSGFKYAYIFV